MSIEEKNEQIEQNKQIVETLPLTNELLKSMIDNLAANQILQTVNAWYEITYLRFVLMKILEKNPEINNNMQPEDFSQARSMAQKLLLEKFPHYGLNFTNDNDSPVDLGEQTIKQSEVSAD